MPRWSGIAGGTGMKRFHFERRLVVVTPPPKLLNLSSLPELPQPTNKAVQASMSEMSARAVIGRLKRGWFKNTITNPQPAAN